jgi:hypothetical protein
MSSDQHFTKSMLSIREQYLLSGGKEPFELRDLAAWAIKKNLYDIPIGGKIKSFCEVMRRILRDEMHTAPNGKPMRTFQCVRSSTPSADGEASQRRLWADVRKADPSFVLAAFNERHKATRFDVRTLQADVETWNACYRPKGVQPIQLNWDFSAPQSDEGLSQVG